VTGFRKLQAVNIGLLCCYFKWLYILKRSFKYLFTNSVIRKQVRDLTDGI